MSEETKGTTATVQTESTEPESQTEPAQRAETLTAEAVSQMIAEAFQGFEQRQSEAKKLAEMTRTDIDTVIVAMELLKKIGLVEVMDDGALYMSQLETMVGSESGSAARMRKMRAKKSEKSLCDKNVTTEKDKELDKEKENTKASELVSDFNVEEAWEFTIKEYPKKTSLTSAKIIWMDKLLEVIEPNRKAVGKLIYEATRVYVADYTEHNPNDTEYRYIPKYGDWLKEDCDYWIRQVEKRERGGSS